MLEQFLTGHEVEFIVKLIISVFAGMAIGIERESRGKSAGISTHCLVIGGAMIFTILSLYIAPNDPVRIAAQIVTGVGFLGAGIIMKENNGEVLNLTTAASIWFSAGIGMLIGFNWYIMAILATCYAVLVPKIPRFYDRDKLKKK